MNCRATGIEVIASSLGSLAVFIAKICHVKLPAFAEANARVTANAAPRHVLATEGSGSVTKVGFDFMSDILPDSRIHARRHDLLGHANALGADAVLCAQSLNKACITRTH